MRSNTRQWRHRAIGKRNVERSGRQHIDAAVRGKHIVGVCSESTTDKCNVMYSWPAARIIAADVVTLANSRRAEIHERDDVGAARAAAN